MYRGTLLSLFHDLCGQLFSARIKRGGSQGDALVNLLVILSGQEVWAGPDSTLFANRELLQKR